MNINTNETNAVPHRFESLVQTGSKDNQRADVLGAIDTFETTSVKALEEQGLTIQLTGALPPGVGGYYRPRRFFGLREPKIVVGGETSGETRQYSIHEMTHALDRKNMEKTSLFSKLLRPWRDFASQHDQKTQELYTNYIRVRLSTHSAQIPATLDVRVNELVA